MASVRAAVFYSSIARFSMRLIGLVATMIIARLLTPGEIGTYGIASGIVMLMIEFRLLGAGNYLVREEVLTEADVRMALGLTIIISWGLGLAILLSAIPVATFYQVPALAKIFGILSISFFFAPYISIPMSLFSRDLAFGIQFKIRFFSSLIGSSLTVGLAFLGASYYSLAFGQLAVEITQFLMLIWIRPPGMKYRPSFRNLGKISKFGIYTSLTQLIKKASLALPDMVIGKLGTTTEVGIFSRGLGFIDFVSQTVMMGVQPVSMPYLSKTKREGGDLTEAYTKASALLGAIVVPVLCVGGVASLPVIRLFFGDQWDAAAPLASWLVIWASFRTVHWFSSGLLMTIGHERLLFIKEFFLLSFLIPGLIYSYSFGLESVAKIFGVYGMLEFALTTIILKKTLALKISKFVRAWIPNIATALVCMMTTWAISKVVSFQESPWKPVIVIATILPFIWIISLALLKSPLFEELRIALRYLRSRNARSNS